MRSPQIEVEGPWVHRYVAANGARFHVAEATPTEASEASPAAPLVLFLHGFPEFWWAWRDQLPAFAAAGYRAVAMDLRGYGSSDKTPRGYDPLTLAADIAGVVHGLGARDAALVGQGWGGYLAWAVAAAQPDSVWGLCAVSAPHPTELLKSPVSLLARAPIAHVAAMQLPWLPERRIMRGRYVAQHLAAWAAPGSGFPHRAVAERYREALALWPSPHCALEYHRWLFRSRLRSDGRAFARVMRRPIAVPVLHVGGAVDPAVRAAAVAASGDHVAEEFEERRLAGVGHFPHEEAPEEFNRIVLGWLSARARPGADGVG